MALFHSRSFVRACHFMFQFLFQFRVASFILSIRNFYSRRKTNVKNLASTLSEERTVQHVTHLYAIGLISSSPMRLKGGMPTAPAPVRVKSVDEAISVRRCDEIMDLHIAAPWNCKTERRVCTACR
eukprot:1674162-Rhodomonas_salina.4